MVPTFYSLLEALQTPAASCRTLCDAEFARRADGSPALTRTSFFTEAPLVWCGARYLLCVPQCGSAIPRVERTAARMKHLHAECLTSYRILRDELAYTDSTGALRRCDAVLHRLPEGEPLAGCALMHDAGELLAALERLAGELAEIGFTHCNLKPDNLYLTPGGRLVPVRYHFARFDEPAAMRRRSPRCASGSPPMPGSAGNPCATPLHPSIALPASRTAATGAPCAKG